MLNTMWVSRSPKMTGPSKPLRILKITHADEPILDEISRLCHVPQIPKVPLPPVIHPTLEVSANASIMNEVHPLTALRRNRSLSCRSQGKSITQRDLFWKIDFLWRIGVTKKPTEASEEIYGGKKKDVFNTTFNPSLWSRFKFHENFVTRKH